MSVARELEEKIRERGVRVRERLALLRALEGPDGEQEVRKRIGELEERIRAAAHKVRGALR